MTKKRKRNFKREYRLRIKRAMAKGLSRTQARGHRRAAELLVSKRTRNRAVEDQKLQLGLRLLRTEKLSTAARHAHISPEKLRTIAVEKGILEKSGRRWVVKKDVTRRVLIYSGGAEHIITVDKFKSASLVGRYMAGVRWFVQTNNVKHLKPFVGKTVKDATGKKYVLETRPNVLHRLVNSGGSSFEQIYRIVV